MLDLLWWSTISLTTEPDTDKYAAHTDLLDREVISTSTLQLENKAVANPGTTVQDLSAFTGQKCFKHTGKCLKIDDTDAMSKACGSGYTVVGWDDAGCGKSNCVSDHPFQISVRV